MLAPGLGGSVRSLGTALKGMSDVRRVVAGPPHSSTSRFLTRPNLSDRYVELPDGSGHRLFDRGRTTIKLARIAWEERRSLAAIHANGLAELNLALLPALVSRRKIVVWVHEWSVPAWTRRVSPLLRAISSIVHYAAVSETSVRMLQRSSLVHEANVSIVGNPVDPDDVRPVRRFESNERFTVAYIGTPASYKGFHLLPALVGLTREDDVRWVVYSGPATMMETTFNELRDLGVDIPGKVTDVRMAYGSCDAVVIPSYQESFGRVAAEAMVNGLPVVASDLPALREVLEESALFVAPGDVEGMASAVRRLANDRGLREQLGRSGLYRSTRFLPGPVIESLSALYGLGKAP